MFVILRIYNLIHVKYEKLKLEKQLLLSSFITLEVRFIITGLIHHNLAEIFLHYFYTSGIITKSGKVFTSVYSPESLLLC